MKRNEICLCACCFFSVFLCFTSCSVNSPWQEDVVTFINNGNMLVSLSSGTVTARTASTNGNVCESQALSKAIIGLENSLDLNVLNPRGLACEYTYSLGANVAYLDSYTFPGLTDDPDEITFTLKDTTPEATVIGFSVSAYVPSTGRTFTSSFEVACQTACLVVYDSSGPDGSLAIGTVPESFLCIPGESFFIPEDRGTLSYTGKVLVGWNSITDRQSVLEATTTTASSTSVVLYPVWASSISTAGELAAILAEPSLLTNAYAVTNSIDMNGVAWTSIGGGAGNEKNEAYHFMGAFDGGGYTIQNLTVTGADDFQGLFGIIGSTGTVRNVVLANATINAGAYNWAGGIAGFVAKGGTVRNCLVDSAVIKTSGSRAGGIAGSNKGTISECGVINSTILLTDTASQYGGGITGTTWGVISNCFVVDQFVNNYNTNTDDSSGNSAQTGGLVGLIETANASDSAGSVLNSYCTNDVILGSISGTQYPYSALVGKNSNVESLGTVVASYYFGYRDTFSGHTASSNFGEAVTLTDLKNTSTLTGWDFDTVWMIDAGKNGGLPYLQCFDPVI